MASRLHAVATRPWPAAGFKGRSPHLRGGRHPLRLASAQPGACGIDPRLLTFCRPRAPPTGEGLVAALHRLGE